MIARDRHRQWVDARVEEALRAQGGGWVGAGDIAREVGLPWRKTARSLLRLVAAEKARVRVIRWQDDASRWRERRQYRWVEFGGPVFSAWPGWMFLGGR